MMKLLGQMHALIGILVLLVEFLCARRAFGRSRRRQPTTNSSVFNVMDEVFSPAA